jgi:hypothetical protein
MKTFLIKKTVELYFEFNKENWDISTAETMAKYVDDSEAYHSTVFYSVSEIEEESEDYDEFGVNLKNTFNTETIRG